MNNAKVKKHIKALKALFPSAFLKPSEEFEIFESSTGMYHGTKGGIWTGFGEDGTIDYWPDGEEFVDEKLTKYMDENDLFAEPYDAGTYMIWSK